MPDTAPPAPITTAFWTPNVREQVVATVLDAARPASTAEGRLIAVTDKDRLEAATGAAWVRVAHWTTSGRTGCILRRVANQSIANTTDTAISWDTEDYDSDAYIAATSDTITIPTALDGIYAATGYVAWASSPGANSNARWALTGTLGDFRTSVGASTVGFQSQGVAMPAIGLAATNTIKLNVYQSSGAAINVTARCEIWRLMR